MAQQWLEKNVGPMLRPIMKKACQERPTDIESFILQELYSMRKQHAVDGLFEGITRDIVQEKSIYHAVDPQPYTPLHVFSGNEAHLPLIKTPGEVTKEWLSKVMAAKVVSFKTIVNSQGQQGVCVILKEIIYITGTPADRPVSCAIKMHAQTEGQRAGCVAVQSYSTEMIFYEKLAQVFPVQSAKCYAIIAQQAPAATRTNGEAVEYFNLVLQDLSVDYEMPGQTIEAGMNYAQSLAAIDRVSDIHLMFWTPVGEKFGTANANIIFAGMEDVYGKPPFVDLAGRPPFAFYEMFWHTFKTSWPATQNCMLTYPGNKQFPNSAWPVQFQEMVSLLDECAQGDMMGRMWEAAKVYVDPKLSPITLIHGDFNAGNIWVHKTDPEAEMLVADWQLSGAFVPGADFPTLLGTAELEEGEDLKLIHWYYDKLCARNPSIKTELSFDQLLHGFFHQATSFLFGYSFYCGAQAVDLESMTKEKADFTMVEFWPLLYVRNLRALLGCGYKDWLVNLMEKAGRAKD